MKFTVTLVSITFVLLKVVSGIPTPNIDEHAMKTKGKYCVVDIIYHLTQFYWHRYEDGVFSLHCCWIIPSV